MKRTSRILLIIIIGITGTYFSYSKILMSPYLQAVTSESIYVMVEADSKKPVTVTYSSAKDKKTLETKTTLISETDANPKTYIHKVKLINLSEGTKYTYSATHENDSYTKKGTFTTAISGSGDYIFGIMGDCRSGIKHHANVAEKMIEYKPLFSLYNGDLCYKSDYIYWKNEFFIPEELNLISDVPFFNAIGNHEGWTNNTKSFLQSPDSKSGKQEYYSFDYGDIHFLILSTEHPCKKGSEQWKFAENDLKSTNKKIKIVAFHESAYCGGGHGDNTVMRTLSEEVFEKLKVDLVITGHSHFYQHNLVNGIHHLTIAGGGAPLYSPKNTKYTVKSAKEYHYGIGEYKNRKLTITVYSEKNKVLDKIEIKK